LCAHFDCNGGLVMDLGLLDSHRLLVGALARAEIAKHLAMDVVGAEPVLPE
jgi:hypothetical protein